MNTTQVFGYSKALFGRMAVSFLNPLRSLILSAPQNAKGPKVILFPLRPLADWKAAEEPFA